MAPDPCAASPALRLAMSWVTIVWSMVASACLTLAAMHVLVWARRRTAWAHLLFALSAAGVAAYAGCELWMMRAETPGEFGVALRWAHVPVWMVVVSLVAFARCYLRAGRLWLAWAAFATRTLALLLNFGSAPNLNYREISALRHLQLLGETVSSGVGTPNPWRLLGPLSLLFLLLFVTDASLEAWRRGDRRQALLVGGSIAFFALGGALVSVLVLGGIVHAPLTASLLYLGLVAAMGYQVSDDVLRAARLSDDLTDRDQQIALVADAADLGLWIWSTPQDTVWATEKLNPMLGFAHGEAISVVSFLEHVHPEDREPTRRALRRALDDRSDYSAEYRVVMPDGSQRWIAASGRVQKPARDGDGAHVRRVHRHHRPQGGRGRDGAPAVRADPRRSPVQHGPAGFGSGPRAEPAAGGHPAQRGGRRAVAAGQPAGPGGGARHSRRHLQGRPPRGRRHRAHAGSPQAARPGTRRPPRRRSWSTRS